MSQSKAQLLDPQGDLTLPGLLIGVGATFSGNVSIGGTLTKQDVTNVDSIGVITARSGIDCTGITSITGADDTDNFVIDVGGGTQFAVHTDTTDGEVSLRSQDGSGNNYSKYMTFFTQPSGAVAAPRLTITSGGGLKYHNADSPTNANSQSQILNHTGGFTFYGSSDSGTHRNIIFGTNNAAAGERLRITTAGLVGIGTAVPSAYLDVESNASSGYTAEFRSVHASNSARILIDSPADNNIRPSSIVLANAGTDKWGIGQVYGSSSSGAFHICAGSASEANSKLTITTSGLVGIATAAPADAFLDIASSAGTEAIRMRRLSSDVNVASNWAFKAYGKNLYFREGSSSPYDRVHFTDTGNVVATGAISDSKGDIRSIPKLTKNSQHALVASDAGQCLWSTSGGLVVNNSVMSAGDAVTFVNSSGSDMTITQGSGVTIYNSNNASTGNRTLAGKGIATLWFSGADTAYISGSGLS